MKLNKIYGNPEKVEILDWNYTHNIHMNPLMDTMYLFRKCEWDIRKYPEKTSTTFEYWLEFFMAAMWTISQSKS